VHLYDVPIIFILAGLVIYTVLGGADFGAGLWQLAAGPGERGRRIRDHAHHAIGPVWEANHIWIVFVLTVSWTSYPRAFSSIASTLCVALFVAGIGMVMRGAAYALRAGTDEPRRIDTLFAVSSIFTPFALGAAVGGIASRRVPVGNAAGDLFSTWINPTSVLVGVLVVVLSGYLAAVYLAADARRLGERELEDYFRARSLGAGVVAGAIAVAGVFVIRSDARPLYDGLVGGHGLAAVIVSALGGVATLALVWRRRYELARFTASLAVAAVVVGWALAQEPTIIPGLTVQQAASPRETLIAVIIAVVAGAVILFPSLAILFSMVLRGSFDRERPAPPRAQTSSPADVLRVSRSGLLPRAAVACLLVGFGFLTIAEAGWAHAIGVVALASFVVLGFLTIVPGELEEA
jgi:cytochrome d ubiquinol oxidase subunit II